MGLLSKVKKLGGKNSNYFDFVHKWTQAKTEKLLQTTGFWKRIGVLEKMVSSDFSTSSCVTTLCDMELHMKEW